MLQRAGFSYQLSHLQAKCVMSACKPGSSLLSAGYCMYSSSVILVLTIGKGVFGFTLDPTVGEFMLSHNNIKVSSRRSARMPFEAFSSSHGRPQ